MLQEEVKVTDWLTFSFEEITLKKKKEKIKQSILFQNMFLVESPKE